MSWLGGVGERDITPPLGVDLTGYDDYRGSAIRIYDRLFTRALALGTADSTAPVVLVSTDLLALDKSWIEAIRSELRDAIPAELLVLNHSHTHHGPATIDLRGMGRPDPSYCEFVVAKVVSAVREAIATQRPVRVAACRSEASIGINRRREDGPRIVLGQNPDGPYDRRLNLLRIEDNRGPLACWFSHGVHPTSLPASYRWITGEWPGVTCRAVGTALSCPALFAQGAAGDVEPLARGDLEAMEATGEDLAAAVLSAWSEARWCEPRSPKGIRESIALPAESGRSLDMEMQAISIGPVAIVAMDLEPFANIGAGIDAESPFPATSVLGYTNGCLGYLGDPESYVGEIGHRGYEIEVASYHYRTESFAPDAPRRVLSAASELLTGLAEGL